ncbi:MAG: nucleotidyltransferase family protein [Bacteroidales bacterium]|nr:nucleotidyltransferase family protein [Bacteroidales bacterium]
MSDIWAIILAAGESKRMKVPKMLLPFHGKTIIETVIENVRDSKTDKTVVVLGSDKEKILKVTGQLPVIHCYNEYYRQGMLSSVICGFRSLPEKFGAALVILGDQPGIGPVVIDEVIDAYRKSGKGIIMPVYKNKHGHPLLVDRKYREEIEKLDPDEGLRSLFRKFPDDVFEVETKNPATLKDIDTQEDYINELKQID